MIKINRFKKLVMPLAVCGMLALTSCNDAKYSVLDSRAFINEALSTTSKKLTVQPHGESVATLSVSLSNSSDVDNHYQLIPDQSVLEQYNKTNGTLYTMLPEGSYTLPDDIVVKAGEYTVSSVPVSLKAFTPEMSNSGESYALPVRLVLKNGNVDAMDETGSFIILADNIFEYAAPMFNGGAFLTCDKFDKEPETYEQFTIEVRFQVSNTRERDRAIFKSSHGDDHNFVLLRFEDPQSDNDEHKAHSLVQVVGRNRIYMNPSNSFEPNKWQHIALVCDGSSYRMYINGKDNGVVSIPSGPTKFTKINWFGKGDDAWSHWSGCKILLSEARIWSVARTANQIENNMNIVSPKSQGLEAYWKFNEGKGGVFQDATGKGHTMVAPADRVTWKTGILSTDVATKW